MPTLNSAKRNTTGQLDAGFNSEVRLVDFIVDFGVDFTMGTATDDINLATLPGNLFVVGASIQQLVPGTGTGTMVVRIGTTAVTATLASTDAAGTTPATVPAAIPLVVPTAGAQLNLLGATAVRNDGRARVTLAFVEGDRAPRVPAIAARDAI